VIERMGVDPQRLVQALCLSADGRSIGGYGYVIRLPTPCAGDVDDGSGNGGRDGGVSIDDLVFFVQHYSTGDLLADLDDGYGRGEPDGSVTIDDLIFFLAGFSQGC